MRVVFLILLLALVGAARGEQTAQEVVANIKNVTTQSQQLQRAAASISIVNGPLIVIGQGPFPTIISGFVRIVITITQAVSTFGSPQYNEADSTLIFNAFRDFVRVHQQLLSILIGKAGLFRSVPFIGEPVANVLVGVENIVDSLAFALIDAAQSQAANLQSQTTQLKNTIKLCIRSYQGIADPDSTTIG